MEKFTRHSGIAAPLLRDNIDTDAIIPSREMKSVSKRGLSAGMFAGWRYLDPDARTPNPDFVLNRTPFSDATVLISGDNFGCGSSREHAVWALREYGLRAIIAASYGEIFYGNCIANGLLPITLPGAQIERLLGALERNQYQLEIDLEAQTISCAQLTLNFSVAERVRQQLLQGLDAIGLTETLQDCIDQFEADQRQRYPWAFPAPP